METILGKTFNKQTVIMDDHNYVNCTFTECEIVYTGGDFSWVTSKFDNCKITITGQAGKTMAFLQNIGILPNPDGSKDSRQSNIDLSDGDNETFH